MAITTSNTRQPQPSTARGNLILLAGSTLFCLLVLGFFVAIDLYRADQRLIVDEDTSEAVYMDDPQLGWITRPDSQAIHNKKGDFEALYTIDADGYRKTVPDVAQPVKTVYFYGDSYTFGHGVNDDQTFASRIAGQLAAQRVRVRNAGVNGYGVVQMYGRAVRDLDQLNPGDVVVFAPTTGDILRNTKDFVFPYATIFRRGPTPSKIHCFPVYTNGTIETIELKRTWQNKLKLLALTAPATQGLWYRLYSLSKPDTTAEAKAMIADLEAKVKARDADFILLFLPVLSECRHGQYQVDVSRFDFPDIRHAFPKEKEAEQALRFSEDSHWNAAGHAIAANAILSVLQQNGVID